MFKLIFIAIVIGTPLFLVVTISIMTILNLMRTKSCYVVNRHRWGAETAPQSTMELFESLEDAKQYAERKRLEDILKPSPIEWTGTDQEALSNMYMASDGEIYWKIEKKDIK